MSHTSITDASSSVIVVPMNCVPFTPKEVQLCKVPSEASKEVHSKASGASSCTVGTLATVVCVAVAAAMRY